MVTGTYTHESDEAVVHLLALVARSSTVFWYVIKLMVPGMHVIFMCVPQQLARKEAVRLFLDYRGAGVRIRDQWTTLLDDNVTLTLPITPYRSFHRSDITNSSRVVRGVDAVMADAASLSLLAEGIGLNSAKWKSAIKR